jgi:hypothetical protein
MLDFILPLPATPKTREMLIATWPAVGDVAIKTLLCEQECYAVRQQALKFIMVAVVCTGTTTILPINQRGFETSEGCALHCDPQISTCNTFSIEESLRRFGFWEALPSFLMDGGATPGFHRVIMELLLWMAQANVKFFKESILLVPENFHNLARYLNYLSSKLKGTRDIRSDIIMKNISKENWLAHLPDVYAMTSHIAKIFYVVGNLKDPQVRNLVRDSSIVGGLFKIFCLCAGHEEEVKTLVYGHCHD